MPLQTVQLYKHQSHLKQKSHCTRKVLGKLPSSRHVNAYLLLIKFTPPNVKLIQPSSQRLHKYANDHWVKWPRGRPPNLSVTSAIPAPLKCTPTKKNEVNRIILNSNMTSFMKEKKKPAGWHFANKVLLIWKQMELPCWHSELIYPSAWTMIQHTGIGSHPPLSTWYGLHVLHLPVNQDGVSIIPWKCDILTFGNSMQ